MKHFGSILAATLATILLTGATLTFGDTRTDFDISQWTYRAADAEKDFRAALRHMTELADALRATQPHLAEKLDRAVELAGKMGMTAGAREITRLLKQGDLSSASTKQKELVGQIESLLAALDGTQKLFSLEKTLREMLEKQKRLSAETRALDARFAAARQAGREPARADAIAALEIAEDESVLACSVADLIDALERDGSTLVFPYLLKEIYGDLKTAEVCLSKPSTAAPLAQLQASVERNLKAMLAALKHNKQLAVAADAEGRPATPPNSRSLIAPLAELTLLKFSQEDVTERTRALDAGRAGRELTEAEREEVEKIAARQKTFSQMTSKLTKIIGGAGE
jgi:hypothetical protein